MRTVRALALFAVALLLGGCVYYNGMYNTKRLASSARKAERDGRTFEANNLWGQVITRAESLVARHPDSKYVDEALVLKGLALSRLRQCDAAVALLGRLSLLPVEADVREEAALALGHCSMEMAHPALADIMFARVARSADPERRAEAKLLRGRALRLIGRPSEAVAELENLNTANARNERLLALAAAHRRDEAVALVDSVLAAADTTARWDTVAALIGEVDPLVASTLVDRVKNRQAIPLALRAQMLYEDGARLVAVDTALGEIQLREVASLPEPPEYVERARLLLLRHRLARTTSAADLRSLIAELGARAAARSTASSQAGALQDMVSRVLEAVDSTSVGAVQSDLQLFLAAEVARDSLAAPGLAVSLFQTIVERIPESPYAPKAILAGHALDPIWGESVLPLLQERYSASPYAALARGEEPHNYRELEDSLRIFAQGVMARSGAGTGRPMLREDSLSARGGATPRPRRGLEP